jgi:hypothetical protein
MNQNLTAAAPNNTARLLGAGMLALLAIAVLAYQWVQHQRGDVRPHLGAGEMLVEQTVQVLQSKEKKRIVLVTVQRPGPELKAQEEGFLKKLKQYPELQLKEIIRIDPEDARKYSPGTGLSARRFARIVENNLKAEAIVSLVGTPDPKDPAMLQLTNKVPRFVAVTRDRDELPALFAKKWIRAAVVPRYDFPAPAAEDARGLRAAFDRYFQVVTTNEVASLPKP